MKRTNNITALMIAVTGAVAPFAWAQLPDPGFEIDLERTALVVTDPQNDFLSPDGATWGVVGKNVTENRTVENIDALFKTAKTTGIQVFVSPHYYYEHDHHWKFEGALESLMHQIKMFDRKGALSTEGFTDSGADWLKQYKPYIDDGRTVVVSPHKVYGPESNDLVLQLRKRGIDQIILAGMSANLCTESHMRELVEQGFEVAVVSDATAAAQMPEYDGYQAAMINFRMIASHVWTTKEATEAMTAASQNKASSPAKQAAVMPESGPPQAAASDVAAAEKVIAYDLEEGSETAPTNMPQEGPMSESSTSYGPQGDRVSTLGQHARQPESRIARVSND